MKTRWPLLLLILVSCTGQTGQKNQQQEAENQSIQLPLPKLGMVHTKVKCIADTNFSYALYLPVGYLTAEKPFPVIFFFDAHQRGSLPLEKYAPLAEKFGFILAGSNNSTNGQQAAEMKRAVSMMMNDVSKRFRIDANRVATAGFSGGARVAADVALFQNKGVSAVIGCAAGFPQMRAAYNSHFSYLGMVGGKDFNYLEMKKLDKALEQTPIPHFLLVYDGKHDWPPAEVMHDGFEFLLFAAMRQNPALKDETIIRHFLARNDSIRKKASAENDLEKLATTNEKVLTFLNGLSPLDKYALELEKMSKNPDFIKLKYQQQKALNSEQIRQQQYASAMPAKDLPWWLAEINRLQKQADPVNVRLLNYLSLVSYMYASGTLKNNQLKEAEKYLTIYEKVDPENPEVYYLKASRLMRMNHPEQALLALQQAVEHGFDEYERMKNSKDFQMLHGNAVFEKTLLEVKNSDGL